MRFTVFLNPEGTHAITRGLPADLPKLFIPAEQDDLIWELVKRAEGESGIEVPDGRLLFATVPDERGIRHIARAPSAVVKEDGVLTWPDYAFWKGVTVADLERTWEGGLYEGDVHSLILDRPTLGNGGLVLDWHQLIRWLVELGAVYGGVAAVRDVVRGIQDRLQLGKDDDISSEAAWLAEFMERNRQKWEVRGASGPVTFLAALLTPRQWDSSQLRRLLQIDPGEAAKFLEVCGYEYRAQTKLYELTREAKERHLRGRLLEKAMEYDPATWQEDLGQA
jgi:hypothetical protein